MDTIFMNSENSKTSNPHRLYLNLSDKINLKRSDKYITIPILASIIHGKIQKVMQKQQISLNSFNFFFHLLIALAKQEVQGLQAFAFLS